MGNDQENDLARLSRKGLIIFSYLESFCSEIVRIFYIFGLPLRDDIYN